MLITGTAIPTSILLYQVVKRFRLLRFMFGLKTETKQNADMLTEKKDILRLGAAIAKRDVHRNH